MDVASISAVVAAISVVVGVIFAIFQMRMHALWSQLWFSFF